MKCDLEEGDQNVDNSSLGPGNRSSWGTPGVSGGRSPSSSVSPGLSHANFHRDYAATPQQTATTNKKKKKGAQVVSGDKSGRGLRQFSMKVCEKVESKGRTTYNEVADELVAEFANPSNNFSSPDQKQYEEKNIRRRVYDALNVLMAMDIISKDKREIQWRGLPGTSLHDIEDLKAGCNQRRNMIEKKATYLRELQEQVSTTLITVGTEFRNLRVLGVRADAPIADQNLSAASRTEMAIRRGEAQTVYKGLQNLIQRNEHLHNSGNTPSGGVTLPFILIQTRPHATVEVEISEDMQMVHFDLNSTPFELHDDSFVLKTMGLCGSQNDDIELQPPKEGVEGHSTLGVFPNQTTLPARPNAMGKPPGCPPIPGILKARPKHDV